MSHQRTHEEPDSNRRDFIKTGAMAAAALAVTDRAAGAAKAETLAMSGGPKAVTFPANRQTALSRWPRYGDAEKKALSAAILGNDSRENIAALEKEWKAYIQVPYVKAQMNGTSALTAIFFALSGELPPGSEIMVPSYTFFATILPMRFFQFVPIFIDVDPRTACFDLEDAKKKLTKNTRAMIPMHSWGLPCEMDQINDWAKEKGLIVIEDAAHAHGASLKGKKMGAWGHMAIFSFQTTKPMPCVEGGMGLYQTREHYERATAFGHYDAPGKFPDDSPYAGYGGTGLGLKYRMHPLAAVLGREQLKVLDQRNTAVRTRVRTMNDRLLQLSGLSEPRCRPEAERVYYNYDMLFIDEAKAGFSRDSVVKALVAEGVRATAGAYPEQHQFKIYSEEKWWHHKPDVPKVLAGCQQVNATCIRLPLFYEDEPELTEQYVKAFEKVWARRSELAKL